MMIRLLFSINFHKNEKMSEFFLYTEKAL